MNTKQTEGSKIIGIIEMLDFKKKLKKMSKSQVLVFASLIKEELNSRS